MLDNCEHVLDAVAAVVADLVAVTRRRPPCSRRAALHWAWLASWCTG
ncbi:hypothetical protein NKG94_14580 [Micromonospora sp. M12]